MNDAQGQGGNSNPGVLPSNAKHRGLTYGEWAAKWWQAAFAEPVVNGDHPIISGGAFGGDDGVVFLAAVVGPPTTVNVTIPSGTWLFLPVVNAECSVVEPEPFHGDNEEELRECANGHIDNAAGLVATIDGTAVKNLAEDFRVESPLFEFGPLPENNLLAFFGVNAPAGTTSDAVDAGVYLLIPPLSVGTHEIHVAGTVAQLGLSVDTTFLITVVPGKR